jgi:hypothetical protein
VTGEEPRVPVQYGTAFFLAAGSGSAFKIQELLRLKMEPWRLNLEAWRLKWRLEAQMEAWRLKWRPGGSDRGLEAQMEAWRLKMEPWRACRPVVADSHHLDEEQDPDPHCSEKLHPDPH